MKIGKTFVSGILAGISIAIGGLVFLSVENRVIGAALFTVGLFSVCSFGFHLFTGKVCYVFQNDKEYAIQLPVIWLGNLVGTGVLAEKAAGLCEVKLSDSFVSLFFLGILCNILIYIAVEGYGKIQHETGKYLALLFGVMVFILCGTEHCVADMFYFWMAGAWSGKAVAAIIAITAGNCVGGVLLPLLRMAAAPAAPKSKNGERRGRK